MNKQRWLGAVGVSMTLAGVAHAEETGIELGVRSGYAIPLGNAGDGDFKDLIGGAIPLWFDLGYRLTPNVMIGAYFQYGFGFQGDVLDQPCSIDGVSCSSHNMRLGGQVHYHFLPWQDVDPWLGAGLGYEWIGLSASVGDQDLSFGYKGFEYVNLQGGVDFLPSDESNIGLGPFISLSVASISKASCEFPQGLPISSDICAGDVDASTHEWLTLGVRGTFVP